MNSVMNYKDFLGSVEFSAEDNCLYGKVIGIADLVSFEGESVEELRSAFEEAVDDYLNLCNETGKKPRKSYKGTFNVRITPELHRNAAFYAATHGRTLNSFVEDAIQHALDNH